MFIIHSLCIIYSCQQHKISHVCATEWVLKIQRPWPKLASAEMRAEPGRLTLWAHALAAFSMDRVCVSLSPLYSTQYAIYNNSNMGIEHRLMCLAPLLVHSRCSRTKRYAKRVRPHVHLPLFRNLSLFGWRASTTRRKCARNSPEFFALGEKGKFPLS